MVVNHETIERGTELRIKGHLYEMQEVNDEVIGGRQGYPMAEKGYEKTLINVADCANISAVDAVGKYIKAYIREHEERPKNRKVRRKAREEVTQAGYPANQYLNRA